MEPRVIEERSPAFGLERLVARFGDRMVKFAEERLGDELDLRLSRITTKPNEAGVDPFGFDPGTARYALAVAAFLHRFYFRTEVEGVDNVPEGRVLVIANHSGQVPIDGVILGTSLMLDAEPPRFPRSMVERWSVSSTMAMASSMRRCSEQRFVPWLAIPKGQVLIRWMGSTAAITCRTVISSAGRARIEPPCLPR